MQEATPEISYYQERAKAIGLTSEKNKLCTPEYRAVKDSKIFEYPLLSEDTKTGDVIIPIYGLDGNPANYYQDNPGKLVNVKTKPFEIRRYKPGNEPKDKDDKPIKYHTPKGAKTLPWIAPNIIEAYNTGTEIDTIVITEGYIKSISGYLNGLYIFGLSGIQNGKDKDTGTLHSAILEVINKCKVNNIILLYDGDANHISLNALNDGKDLHRRPNGFYTSAINIKELLKDSCKDRHFDIYFASINTAELDTEPKGLDDLLQTHFEKASDIIQELTKFSKQKPHYFTRIPITVSARKVLDHLHITNADVFYSAHNQLIKDKSFVYNGTRYKYDEEKKTLKVEVPGAAKFYFRVGTNYYKHIKVPNKYGVLEQQYVKWQIGTVVQDHGKEFVKHIQKFEAFCVKPDHFNFQQVIDNCFNRYRPFEHEIGTSNECPETLGFFKHIFADQLELGLDYVHLLLTKPQQILPILCLVSRENNTGKSTFGKLLKAIFTGNMAFIGNADLESDFNSGWGDKLLICCEESFIDKKKTVEKVKSLSTGDKLQMNQKGVDQVEIDFFGKFIFMSNNEDNFVIANEHDERFWVRKIPKATIERTNLLELMIDEVPAFLYYLNTRQLSTKRESRMWFAPLLLKTDALKKLVEGNKSGPQKELGNILKNLFVDAGFYHLEFTLKYICETLLRNRYEKNYINRVLTDMGYKADLKSSRFKYPEIKTVHQQNHTEEALVINSALGKPYIFKAHEFLSDEELNEFMLSKEAVFQGQGPIVPFDIWERYQKAQNTTEEANAEEVAPLITADNGTTGLPF